LFVLDATCALYRLDPRTGDRKWDFQFPTSCVRGAPLVTGDDAYVGLDDGSVACVEVATGEQVWKREFLDIGAAGAMGAAPGRLLVPFAGRGGGVVGFVHVHGPLQSVESPTVLHLGLALGNFGAAAAVVFAGLLIVFRGL